MPSEPPDVLVRPGQATDGPAVGDLYVAARAAAVPSMPPSAHSDRSMRKWIAEQLAGEREAWVAEEGGAVVAFMLLEDTWLHSLYVRPDRTGAGIGTVLLELALTQRPDGLQLWVFESNAGAQRLYARHGFAVVERTDGAGNEERAPDLRMAWPGTAVVALRHRIDHVDYLLGGLLDQRARLTAAVQEEKARSGHTDRDPEREAEIVARVAERAPYLGVEAVGRIMHAVITASLDAADG